MKVAIVGAGPAGLATLKHLKASPQFFGVEAPQVTVFEAESEVGGTLKYRVYEDAEMVSSKHLTAFSDFRLPDDAPAFPSAIEYCNYLDRYCDKFDLWDHIVLSTKVTRIQRNEKGGHIVTTVDKDGNTASLTYDAVAVCSGLHVDPSIPTIKGLDQVPVVLHSSQFKNREQFSIDGQDHPTVVVVGAGETAQDLAHLAVTTPHVKTVVMCHKDGFSVAPKKMPLPIVRGRAKYADAVPKPMDTTIASLFDTAYTHPTLQKAEWVRTIYKWTTQYCQLLVTGTTKGYDQWVGTYDDERFNPDSVFLVKSSRAIPYISAIWRNPGYWNRVRASILNVPIPDTHGRHIEVAPWPDVVDENGFMHFKDTGRPESERMKTLTIKPDVVLLATGYTRHLTFLDHDSYGTPDGADVRGIYYEKDVSVGFIGFVRPSFGAIPPLAELESQLWVLRLLQAFYPHNKALHTRDPNAISQYEMDYKLQVRAGRNMSVERCGVEQESYAYQLALDIGSAPRFTYIRRQGWEVLLSWAMTSNMNPKFILVGPWKQPKLGLETMRTEIYKLATWTGPMPFFIPYTLLPLILFGICSLALYAFDVVTKPFIGLVSRPKARYYKKMSNGETH